MREASVVRSLRFSFAAVGRLLLLVMVVGLCSCPLMAQATRQGSGVVFGPAGQVVPGVKVELTNVATARVRTVATGSDGAYLFPLVDPAIYRLKATATGFKTINVERVEVDRLESRGSGLEAVYRRID